MRCRKCGYEVSGRFCSNCGTVLQTGGGNTASGGRKNRGDEEYIDDVEDINDRDYLDDDYSGRSGRSDRAGAEPSSPAAAFRNPSAQGSARPGNSEEKGPVRAPRSRKSDSGGKSRGRDKSRTREKTVKKEKSVKKEKPQSREEVVKATEKRSRRSRKELPYNEISERRAGRRRLQESSAAAEGDRWNAGDVVAKGAVGAVILASRIMQLISCFFMAAMVWNMAFTFLKHGNGLGVLDTLITDENYALGLYAGAAGFSLFMGVVWCLWILSRKSGGGEIRLKKYDIGRGFYPFLICLAAVFFAGMAKALVPSDPEAYRGMAGGAGAFLNAVLEKRSFLMTCCTGGAILSFIRKVLRV